MARSHPKRITSSSKEYESRFDHAALFEFSRVINSSLDQRFIISHILLTIMGKMLATKGMVLLDRSEKEYTVEMVKGFPPEMVGTSVTIDRIPKSLFHLKGVSPSRYPWVSFFRQHSVDMVLPMFIAAKPIGFLAFGGRFSMRSLTTLEETYLRSLANISATAIEKTRTVNDTQQINRKLDMKVQELNTLFELSKEFGSLLDPEKQMRLLVFSLMGQVGVNRYLICLKKGADMRIVASRINGPEPQGNLLKELEHVKKPTLVDDLTVKRIPEIRDVLSSLGIRVAIPMQSHGEIRGVILLGEKLAKDEFVSTDFDFLSSLSNLAMISLENARLFKEAIEKQRLEDELMIAREIQKGLLPSVLPVIPGISVAATNISSKQVGGDYYDVLRVSENRWVIAIGDVSGKGTPAALLMANLQATIRALVPFKIPLGELTGRVNDLMCQNTGGTKFVTFFWGIVDISNQTLTYVNAGHNYPFLVRADRSVERLDKGGMILGVIGTDRPYEEGVVRLRPNDLLVLFTDGVSEAMNKDSREYGEDCLETLVRGSLSGSAEDVMHRIQQDIQDHAAGAPQSDDVTMMVLKVERD